MASLSYKIEAYLGRKAKFSAPGSPGEVTLENSGDGDKITYWADSIEKSKPTDSQLNTANTQADTDFTNFKAFKSFPAWLPEISAITFGGIVSSIFTLPIHLCTCCYS